jgi:bacterioferritin-associated ferredoxin
MSRETIVCRCEDVSREEILEVIRNGATSIEEVKRLLRCGMGHCQGRGCARLIAQMICQETGKQIGELQWPTSRPPLIPIPLGHLAQTGGDGA